MNAQPYRAGLRRPITQTRNRTSGGTYQLGGGNASSTVIDARSRLQEHYNLEAQVAAEKRKEKERKKKMEWLERQEKLVKPGYVLGVSHESSPEAKLQCDPQNCDKEVIAAGGQFSADDSETQRDYRSEMAAARARFQEHYNAALQQTTGQ